MMPVSLVAMNVARAIRNYTALDGSKVVLASTVAPGGPVFEYCGCHVHGTGYRPVRVDGRVTGGGRATAFSPQIAVETQIIEEYSHSGGVLVLASGLTPTSHQGDRHWDLTVSGVAVPEALTQAIWEGQRFSLRAHAYGPVEEKLPVLIEVFGHLVVDEVTDGVSVRPTGDATFYLDEGPTIDQEIRDVALIELMQLTQRNAKILPRTAGTSVPGGELFAHRPSENSIADHDHDLVPPGVFIRKVTPTAIATLLPRPGVSEQALMEVAVELQVEWAAPS